MQACKTTWQGRQESNPQPTVLETATLPIELHPYPITSLTLLCFFVYGMFLAKLAILAQFNTIRIVFLVLIGLIVALFAFRTSQRNRVTHRLYLSYLQKSLYCKRY